MKRVLGICTALLALFGCGPAATTQQCASLKAGDLVITEAMIDPDGADTGNEWFEVYNTSSNAIELKGLTLFVSGLDGSSAKTHVIRAGTAQPGAYFTFGDIRSGPNPAWIGYSYSNGLGSFSNTSGIVGVRCGKTDLARFTWAAATKSGHAQQLDSTVQPSAERASNAANFCPAPAAISAYSGNNFGTPGGTNGVCDTSVVTTPGKCTEGGVSRDIISPVAGDLLISEVMNHPSNGAANEWIELNARNSFDLNGLKVTNTSGSSKTISGGACLAVNAGDYVVLAANADAGAAIGLPTPIFVYGSLSLTDTGAQSLTLSLADGGIIDVANYNVPNAATGKSQQLDLTTLDSASNDDPANFCSGQAQWAGGDFGTPGATNAACPVIAQPGECLDNGTPRAIVSPAVGDAVITEVMAAPTTNANDEWVEVLANTAFDLNGLTLTYGSTTRTVTSAACIPVAAGQHVVLAKSVPNTASLPAVDYAYGTLSLTNSSAASLTLGLTGVGDLDVVNFATPVSGKSWSLDPTMTDATSNDVATSFCAAQTQWAGVDYGTPGAANDACPIVAMPGECMDNGSPRAIVSPAAGDLVITEVMNHPSNGATNEWIELNARSDFDLNGIKISNTTGSSKTITAADCMPVTTGAYVLLAAAADGGPNLPVPTFVYGSLSLTDTGAQSLTLSLPDAGVLDVANYNVPNAMTGKAQQLNPATFDANGNDDPANFCSAQTQWAGGDFGTPGAVNSACPVVAQAGECLDNGTPRAIVSPNPGDARISEIMGAPSTNANDEWVEVLANTAFDLNGLTLANSTTTRTVTSAACVPVSAGQYVVLSKNLTNTASLPTIDYAYGTLSISNTAAGSLTLGLPDAGVVDLVNFAKPLAGKSWSLNLADAGFCAASSQWAGVDFGTPGAVNDACP